MEFAFWQRAGEILDSACTPSPMGEFFRQLFKARAQKESSELRELVQKKLAEMLQKHHESAKSPGDGFLEILNSDLGIRDSSPEELRAKWVLSQAMTWLWFSTGPKAVLSRVMRDQVARTVFCCLLREAPNGAEDCHLLRHKALSQELTDNPRLRQALKESARAAYADTGYKPYGWGSPFHLQVLQQIYSLQEGSEENEETVRQLLEAALPCARRTGARKHGWTGLVQLRRHLQATPCMASSMSAFDEGWLALLKHMRDIDEYWIALLKRMPLPFRPPEGPLLLTPEQELLHEIEAAQQRIELRETLKQEPLPQLLRAAQQVPAEKVEAPARLIPRR